MHKYDPTTYTVIGFSQAGRKQTTILAENYQKAVEAATLWDTENHGTSVILKCLRNSALSSPCFPEADQQ